MYLGRSFRCGGSGGGGAGGVGKGLRAGGGGAPPEPFSSSANSTTHLNENQFALPTTVLTTLSSSSTSACTSDNGPSAFSSPSPVNMPISAASGAPAPAWGSCCSDDAAEWEGLDGNDDDEGAAALLLNYEEFVFGTPPSIHEVNSAVSALKKAVERSSSFTHSEDTSDVEDEYYNRTEGFGERISSEVDWVEPSLTFFNSRMLLQPHGSDRVYDAFHLLQSEPSVQRMVNSLSSDKAVWDAVMNNKVVKELRSSIRQADEHRGTTDKGSDDCNPVEDILSWAFANAKANIVRLINKIVKLVNEVFRPPDEEKKAGIVDHLEEKLKPCLFLSIIVLLIVVVTRARSA